MNTRFSQKHDLESSRNQSSPNSPTKLKIPNFANVQNVTDDFKTSREKDDSQSKKGS